MIRPLLALVLFALPAAAQAEDRGFIIGSYDNIRIDGPFEVHLTTGKSPSARATGNADALDSLSITVEGDTLVVSLTGGNWSSDSGAMITAPVITLATPNLRNAVVNSGAELTIDAMKGQDIILAINGSGALTVGAIDAQQFTATIVGTGSMTLAGKTDRATFALSGPGSIAGEGLMARDLVVRSDGSGVAHLAARYTADVTTTGLGLVTVAGEPSCTVHAIAGGPVRCGKQAN